MLCHACQKPVPFVEKLPFRAECPACHADAHVCRNCQFYDTQVYNECRETSAERVTDKEKFNFCDYFVPAEREGKTAALSPSDIAKQKLGPRRRYR